MISKKKIEEKFDKVDWNLVNQLLMAGVAIGVAAWGAYVIGWNVGWTNGCSFTAKSVQLYGPELAKPVKDMKISSEELFKILDDPKLTKYVNLFKIVKF